MWRRGGAATPSTWASWSSPRRWRSGPHSTAGFRAVRGSGCRDRTDWHARSRRAPGPRWGWGGSRSRAVVELDGEGRRAVELPEGEAWGFLAGSLNGEWLAGARHARGQWDVVTWKRDSPGEVMAV